MQEYPLISIVVPVYKVEKYLQECVNSLLQQTYPNIEIILVDDGSPDKCPAICDAYAKSNFQIKVVHQLNAGLSAARNTGVEHATGQYICFVDSDDLVAPMYCEQLYNLLKNTECDFSVCSVKRFDDGANFNADIIPVKHSLISNSEFLKLQFERRSEFGVWNKLYRKRLFDKMKFAEGKLHEDVIWSADLAANCTDGVIMTSEQLYFYRQREGGIVSQGSVMCSPDRIYACSYLLHTVEKHTPELFDYALAYAVEYPWSFVDKVYVSFKLWKNRKFLKSFRRLLLEYRDDIQRLSGISLIQKKRITWFSVAPQFYVLNTTARLLRVIVYRKFLGKDPYVNDRGI